MRKFKLCICKKINFFGAADVKLKKDMILAGKLQFYQLQKRKTKKNWGSDGIWTQASQNITTNWATEVNVNSSALMPISCENAKERKAHVDKIALWSYDLRSQFYFLPAKVAW